MAECSGGACTCEVQNDGDYCSDTCKGETSLDVCNCGHAGCEGLE